jgi:DNA-binding LytR/AlgR family response regulator
MQKVSVYIVDDEPHYISLIARYIEQTPFLQLAGSHTNPLLALEAMKNQPPHLALLDISMPELSGIELMKLLHAHTRTRVIFTTGYSQYAVESYEHNVVDYLLKPFEYERFLKAVFKARDGILPELQAASTHIVIPGQEKNQKRRIEINTIHYIESQKNYTIFHCADGSFATYMLLKDAELLLPPGQFLRVHRSYIINTRQVAMISTAEITLQNNSIIPVSEGYRNDVMRQLAG